MKNINKKQVLYAVGALLAIGVVIGGLQYYFYLNKVEVLGRGSKILPWPSPQVVKVEIERDGKHIVLEKKGQWFIRKPIDFQADNGIIEHDIGTVYHARASEVHRYKRDLYGLNPGLGTVKLSTLDGETLTLQAGSEMAKNSQIYLVDKPKGEVYIAPNFWRKFFSHEVKDYINKQINRDHIGIEEMNFQQNGQSVWSVIPTDPEKPRSGFKVMVDGKEIQSDKKRPRRAFRNVRRIPSFINTIPVEEVLMDQKDLSEVAHVLTLKGREKKLILKINGAKDRIHSSTLGAVAVVKPTDVDDMLDKIKRSLLGEKVKKR